MNPALPLLRLPIAAALLVASACDSSAPEKSAPKADTKNADTKNADAKNADAKNADAKNAGAKSTDAKNAGSPSGEAKPPPVADRKYRRGQLAPAGMSPEEIKKFATDTGDPTGGTFTLEQAFAGDPQLADPSNGTLTASFDTTMGSFDCELYEDQAPLTVANFVGLARGERPTYDKRSDAWVKTKYYDGVIFHRVIKGFMVQTGDGSGSGRGNPGFVIPDEFVKGLKHSSAGILSMANRSEPNTGNSQFFITVRDTKHLDGKHAVFGKCPDAKVPIAISKVKVDHRSGDRPYETVKVNAVTISRKKT